MKRKDQDEKEKRAAGKHNKAKLMGMWFVLGAVVSLAVRQRLLSQKDISELESEFEGFDDNY